MARGVYSLNIILVRDLSPFNFFLPYIESVECVIVAEIWFTARSLEVMERFLLSGSASQRVEWRDEVGSKFLTRDHFLLNSFHVNDIPRLLHLTRTIINLYACLRGRAEQLDHLRRQRNKHSQI